MFAIEKLHVTLWTKGVFAGEITMPGTDGERRRDGDVWQAEIFESAADQLLAGFGGRDTLAHVQMQHSAAGIFLLQLLLQGQGLKRIVRVANGNWLEFV